MASGKKADKKVKAAVPAGFVKKNASGRVEGTFFDLKPGTKLHGELTDAFSYRNKLSKKQTAVYILKTKEGNKLVSEKIALTGMREFRLGTEVYMVVNDYKKLPRGKKFLEIDLYAKDETAPKKGPTALDAIKTKRLSAEDLDKVLGTKPEDEDEGESPKGEDIPF